MQIQIQNILLPYTHGAIKFLVRIKFIDVNSLHGNDEYSDKDNNECKTAEDAKNVVQSGVVLRNIKAQ